MACKPVTPITPIDFVISLEIPCGYYLNDTVTSFDPELYLDTHCAFCINEQLKQIAQIEGLGACEICVNRTVLVGAIHYEMVLRNFKRRINGNPGETEPAPITKAQSICIHSLPVAMNCEDCPDEPCKLTLDNFKFVPTYEKRILYTNNTGADGIEYTPATADDFLDALKNGTDDGTLTGVPNVNGCKTIVFIGKINVILIPPVPAP